ncbi:MFS general substrate transporter [Dentipellis sp. KUC8613]|nr:MFS general substrate transporter [Dentipellis sp. KUC8613]
MVSTPDQPGDQDGRSPAKAEYSKARRYSLLILFCLAQFVDTFNISALYPAIPTLAVALGMSTAESTWIMSAYSLTFAAFLLISGRISDVYSSKYAFIIGTASLGIISLGAGFLNSKIPLIVLRALYGIAGSLTIPSALALIVAVFPEPLEQSRAIGAFGGCAAIGNVLGFIIGGIFSQFASWHWVFWFVTLISLPVAGLCLLLIPDQPRRPIDDLPRWTRFKRLDIVGVGILTAALILFIFAVISGSTNGWATVIVLVPLFISVAMLVCFFFYETRIPIERAAIPPYTWFYPNFSVVFGASLLPFFWWAVISLVFTNLWQGVYHRSPISTAIHLIPSSVAAFFASFTGPLSRHISPKWLILLGQLLIIAASLLLAFADGADKYWRLDFPGFALGSAGAQLIYTHTNVAIFRTTPPSMAGTVGAIYNGALQLGSAVGLASITSIENSVNARHGGPDSYAGVSAAYWFVFATACVEMGAILLWYDVQAERMQDGKEKDGGAVSTAYVEKASC